MMGATFPRRQPIAGKWLQRLALIALGLLLLAPHMLPGAEIRALDAGGGAEAPVDIVALTQMPGHNFPGSAYFFAQGAFDAQPVANADNPHIYQMESGPAAPAMLYRAASTLDQGRALNCLTAAIYYEAGNEPDEGQRAVAQVVLNRVRHPAWPNSICGVVYQDSQRTDLRCQFTFTCDGALLRVPARASWARAARVAQDALLGAAFAPIGMATNYHTLAVRPAWASTLAPVAVVGAHIFYRLRGPGSNPTAFTDAYSGREPVPPPYRPVVQPMLVADVLAATPLLPGMPLGDPATRRHYVPGSALENSGLPLGPAPAPLAARPGGGKSRQPLDAWSSSLPESTIRPEFADSGRPLS